LYTGFGATIVRFLIIAYSIISLFNFTQGSKNYFYWWRHL